MSSLPREADRGWNERVTEVTESTKAEEKLMRNSISIVVLALAVGGCAASQARPQPTTTEAAAPTETPQEPGTHGGMMGHMCPMAVEGTMARAEDVEGGAAMVFTTTGDVAELRRRVARIAEMHNRHHDEGHGHGMGMMEGQHGGGEPPHGDGVQGGTGMMGGGVMPPSDARSEELEGGARLIFIPRDPADLDRLREHVGRHAEVMASGRCPMMSMHGHSEATAPSDHDTHHPEERH